MSERLVNASITQREREPLQDRCGLVAAFAKENVRFVRKVYDGLMKEQTRGYDGAGIVAIDFDGKILLEHKGEGLVDEVFNEEVLGKFDGISAPIWVGQVRYGTSGDPERPERSTQPVIRKHSKLGVVALGHNGNFDQDEDLQRAESDTVVFANELAEAEGESWDEVLYKALKHRGGAWSLTVATPEAMYLHRDPRGIRPLAFGRYWDETIADHVWLAASETNALSTMGVSWFYEVKPGQTIKITKEGVFTTKSSKKSSSELCIFENVYLKSGNSKALLPRSRPEEINLSPKVGTVRKKSGEILAREAPVSSEAVDFVVGIPGTGIAAGRGFANALGLDYMQAINDRKNQKDQRTFMKAKIDTIYQEALKHFKFNANAFRGKRVVLVDDSIVRGNVMPALIKLLKEQYGALKVHVRIACRPIDKPCNRRGVNTREKEELIAAQVHEKIGIERPEKELVEEIRKKIGADSLAYISDEGLREAQTGNPQDNNFCMDCMVGHIYSSNKAINGNGKDKFVFKELVINR